MSVLSAMPHCVKCGWSGGWLSVDTEEFHTRDMAEVDLQDDVRAELNQHLYNDCPNHERWEYVPTYKCDRCRQMIQLKDNNQMPRHADKTGEECPNFGRLHQIAVVNGGAQGTGKKR